MSLLRTACSYAPEQVRLFRQPAGCFTRLVSKILAVELLESIQNTDARWRRYPSCANVGTAERDAHCSSAALPDVVPQ